MAHYSRRHKSSFLAFVRDGVPLGSSIRNLSARTVLSKVASDIRGILTCKLISDRDLLTTPKMVL